MPSSSYSNDSRSFEEGGLKRLPKIRSKRRPGAPTLELFEVYTSGSSTSKGLSDVQISADSESIEVLVDSSDSISSASSSITPKCEEVLLNREPKARKCFFPPSVRSEISTSIDFPSFSSGTSFNQEDKKISFSNEAILSKFGQSSSSTHYNTHFHIGDRVDVIKGEHKGCSGTVVQILKERVHVFVDFKNATWSLPLENVQPYVFIPRQKDRGTTMTSHPPLHNASTRSSAIYSSSIQNDSTFSVSTEMESVILFKHKSPKERKRQGQLVETIEGPKKEYVPPGGSFLRATTADVVQLLTLVFITAKVTRS